MVGDISIAENIYIACGKTDMRKSIDGLAAMVQSQYHLDPFSKSIFLFCGGKSDRIKILMWKATVSCFFIRDWSQADSAGPEYAPCSLKRKLVPLVSESLAVHSGNVMPLLAESACRRSGICNSLKYSIVLMCEL